VSVGMFLVAFGVVAGVLALWVDYRFPALAPETLGRAFIHVGASLLATHLIVRFGVGVLLADASETVRFAAVFGVALPVLAYAFLAGFWILKIVHRTMRGLPR
jgi:hypothetical protein